MKFGSESLKFRQGNLELLEAKSSRLQAELAQLERREAEVAAANLEVERLQNYLAEQDDELEAEAARSDVEQMQRIQMTLFTMVPRYGFVRYLLRIALHREDMAQQTGATAVSLTRSLRELFGSHLQKVQLNAKQDQFTLSARIVEVHQLQLSWEPFLRAVFALYAEQGRVANGRGFLGESSF